MTETRIFLYIYPVVVLILALLVLLVLKRQHANAKRAVLEAEKRHQEACRRLARAIAKKEGEAVWEEWVSGQNRRS